MKKNIVENLICELRYSIVSENANTQREVDGLSISRAGMQLANMAGGAPYSKYIVGWGTAEAKYLISLSKEERMEKIKYVVTEKTPLLVLSQGFKNFEELMQEIVEYCSKIGTPVVNPKERLANIVTTFSLMLSHVNAKVESVHGSLVIINGLGVMIIGKSGIGKSEAVLELIQNGHTFVSDDTVEIIKNGQKFIGRAAALTRGLLEARGIGLINIPFIYGARSTKYESIIDLVVELVPEKDLNSVDRLGNKDLKYNILGFGISKIQIPTASGRSIASLVVAASNVYSAREQGMDPLQTIKDRREND